MCCRPVQVTHCLCSFCSVRVVLDPISTTHCESCMVQAVQVCLCMIIHACAASSCYPFIVRCIGVYRESLCTTFRAAACRAGTILSKVPLSFKIPISWRQLYTHSQRHCVVILCVRMSLQACCWYFLPLAWMCVLVLPGRCLHAWTAQLL